MNEDNERKEKRGYHTSDQSFQETRISVLETQHERTKEQLSDINSKLDEIHERLKKLNDDRLTMIIHEQNQEVIKTLSRIIDKKIDAQSIGLELSHEKSILESKVKLKIWHIIGLIIASGLFTIFIDFIRESLNS